MYLQTALLHNEWVFEALSWALALEDVPEAEEDSSWLHLPSPFD